MRRKQSLPRPLLLAVLVLLENLAGCSEEITCHLCYMAGCLEGPYSNCTTLKLHGCSKVDVKLSNGLVSTLAKGCYAPGSGSEDPTHENCVTKTLHGGLYTVHRCYRCDANFCNGSSCRRPIALVLVLLLQLPPIVFLNCIM